MGLENYTTLQCGLLLDEADRARFCRDFESARDYLQKTLIEFPYCAEAYFRKSLLYFESDNKLMKYEQKQYFNKHNRYRCVKEAQLCHPNKYFSLLCEGYLAEIQGDLDTAAMYFEKATHVTNDNPYTNHNYEAYFKLGFVKMDKEDYDGAIECYQRAIEENLKASDHHRPHITALCYNNIGCCFQDQHQLDLARDYFQKAIQTFPKYVLPRCNIVDICNELGEHEQAVEECEKILQECTDKNTKKFTMMDLLDALFQSMDFERAWDMIKKIQQEFPDDYYAYAFQSDLEDTVESKLEIVNEGLKKVRDPTGIAELILCRATIYEEMGQIDLSKAEKSLKLAMDKGMLTRID
jgi:tetratricopeptide (TPR) repeat protein